MSDRIPFKAPNEGYDPQPDIGDEIILKLAGTDLYGKYEVIERRGASVIVLRCLMVYTEKENTNADGPQSGAKRTD